MICDPTKYIAIGGIMGGLNTEVSEGTASVLLESAYFNPPNIRRTSRMLGIQTESSARFEKGIDPETDDIKYLDTGEPYYNVRYSVLISQEVPEDLQKYLIEIQLLPILQYLFSLKLYP